VLVRDGRARRTLNRVRLVSKTFSFFLDKVSSDNPYLHNNNILYARAHVYTPVTYIVIKITCGCCWIKIIFLTERVRASYTSRRPTRTYVNISRTGPNRFSARFKMWFNVFVYVYIILHRYDADRSSIYLPRNVECYCACVYAGARIVNNYRDFLICKYL
jgi:hypothetical protein